MIAKKIFSLVVTLCLKEDVLPTMTRPVIRVEMRKEHHWNVRIESGSLSYMVLDILYDREKMMLPELRTATQRDVRMTIHRLAKRHLMVQNSDKTYSLTDSGRWLAISGRLNLSFLELCLLACACCTHERYAAYAKGPEPWRKGFYMRPTFDKIFNRFYSGKYISVVFSTLKRKGFAFKFSKMIIQIHQKVWKDLMSMYGKDFHKLERNLEEITELWENADQQVWTGWLSQISDKVTLV